MPSAAKAIDNADHFNQSIKYVWSNHRLSKHFMLTDILFNAHHGNYGKEFPSALQVGDIERGLIEAQPLIDNLIEPMVALFGPCSVSAGFAPHAEQSPHSFSAQRGAAIDLAFHDYHRQDPSNPNRPMGRSPMQLVTELCSANIPFHRVITYAGSEFICFAHHSRTNTHRIYENRRTWTDYNLDVGPQSLPKPLFITHSRSAREKGKFASMGLPAAEWDVINRQWRRDPHEPIYHTRRSIRPQHVKRGRYFTLMDFCMSEIAVASGMRNMPQLTDAATMGMARTMGMIMDHLVVAVGGRISITRGHENRGVNISMGSNPLHNWSEPTNEYGQPTARGMDVGRIEFVPPEGTSRDTIESAIANHPLGDSIIAAGSSEFTTGDGGSEERYFIVARHLAPGWDTFETSAALAKVPR
jgi:hypothetical protein